MTVDYDYWFNEGAEAFLDNYSIGSCPYEDGTQESEAWLDGWFYLYDSGFTKGN